MHANSLICAAVFLALAGFFPTVTVAKGGSPASAPPSPRGTSPSSFADIVQQVAPAVVSIEIVGEAAPATVGLRGQGAAPFSFRFNPNSPFGFDFRQLDQGRARQVRSSASGFFISPDGYVLTNNHVIDGAERIMVQTSDGRSLPATVVGADTATDLAVLQVAGRDFPFLTFEDSAKPRVGDWVVAVGNPYGLGGTATAGIISALSRPIGGSSYVDYMQIDAPINRGNSGGPTFDVRGRVIGVNTSIFTLTGGSVGIGFDIPADVAEAVSRELIEHHEIVRGYIGATVQNLSPDLAESLGLGGHKGALVAEVNSGGPSDAGGLKSGDVIEKIDGVSVTSAADLTRRVALVAPGQTIRLGVRRNGHPHTVALKAGERPSEHAIASGVDGPASGSLGMRLTPNTDGGLTVEGVAGDSDAQRKGIRRGDVILRAGNRDVLTAADLEAAVTRAKRLGRHDLTVLVVRGGRKQFVPLAIGEAKG